MRAWLLPLTLFAFPMAAAVGAEGPRIVSQKGNGPFSGVDERPIVAAIADAVAKGGGDIVIEPGVYSIRKSIVIDKAQHVQIRGSDAESVILKLPPLAFGVTAEEAPAGATELRMRRAQNLQPGMLLHLNTTGAIDKFSNKPKPYVLATIRKIDGDSVTLTAPLSHPVPAGTTMRNEDAPNLIEIRGGSSDILIEKVTLDGGRAEGDPPIQGHARLCGVFVEGAYTYEKGPTGPPVREVMINRCLIRNCFGRGVAFYSVNQGFVIDTTITDTNDEAVDFDHFTVRCAMQGCHVARCRIGIELNDANDCLVQHNEFRECAIGLNLWRWCRQEDLNRRNAIRGNLFENVAENAVQLGPETSGNLIEDNTVSGAGRSGIVVNGDDQQVIKNRIDHARLKAIAVARGVHRIEGNVTE